MLTLSRLEETAQAHAKDFLHIKIAEIHIHFGKHDLAIEHFNTALS